MRASTAKSLNDFGSCFTRIQDRDARAWAFMPTQSGGTFTNAGASGAAAPYWLAFTEMKPANQVRLFAAADQTHLREAVQQCR